MLLQSFWPHSSQTCHSVSAEFLLSVFSVRLWFKYFFHFHPYLGKISNLTSIFFRWVEIPTRFDTPTGGTANTWANSLGFREVIDEMMMKWWNDRRFFFQCGEVRTLLASVFGWIKLGFLYSKGASVQSGSQKAFFDQVANHCQLTIIYTLEDEHGTYIIMEEQIMFIHFPFFPWVICRWTSR